MIRGSRLTLFVIVSLLLNGALLFAGGQKEDPIAQARSLIAENRFNEATILLQQAVREDPEKIYQAEELIEMIREIRGEYNVKLEQLVDNLINNPEDIETTLRLIDEMESIDPFPNPRVAEQIEEARVVAQLAYDRNLLNETMDRALREIEAGNYIAAIEEYRSVRELQLERFEQRGYGDIFLQTVDDALSTMYTAAEQFVTALPQLENSAEELADQIAERPVGPENESLTQLLDLAVQINETRRRASEAANEIAVSRAQVGLQFPDNPIDWYLVFQDYLARGRQETRDQEGLLTIIARAYQEEVDPLAELANGRWLQVADGAEEAYQNGDYQSAQEQYQAATDLSSTAVALNAAVNREPQIRHVPGELPPADAGGTAVEAGYLYHAYQITSDLAVRAGGVQEVESEPGTTIPEYRDGRSQLDSIQAEVADLRAAWERTRESLNDQLRSLEESDVASEIAGARLESAQETLGRRFAELDARSVRMESQLVIRISEARTAPLEEQLATLEERYASTIPLLDGVEEEFTDDDGNPQIRVSRYPDNALERFQDIIANLNPLENEYRTYFQALATEQAEVRQLENVQDEITRLDENIERMTTLSNQLGSGVAMAQDLIDRAIALREEGRDRVEDARAAIASLQIQPAKNNWNAARDAFLTSLDLLEDPEFRSEADEVILQIGREIQEAENVIVVQRVRELLNQAETQYNRDEYIAAQDTLLRAREEWSKTNVEDNPEIERLVRLVNAALSLAEGRELTVADPLYPVLANYLSLAKEDFNRAQDLSNQGKDEEANVFFERAIENLRNVREVRPLNWEARILELRIAQIRSADEFPEVFEARYQQAIDRLGEASPVEIYGELEALAEINPSYPGLQEQIRRLEVQLNLREDPVDQQRIVQANQLVARAEDLADTGNRDQIVVAVSLLEQAVDLNPNDGDAKFLLDQLRIQLGGQAAVSLSSADEQQYRRAETLYTQGRVLQALAIVERLLANENNQNYPPLVDLRRRIALRLGI